MKNVLEIAKLSKSYELGTSGSSHGSLRESITKFAKGEWLRRNNRHTSTPPSFWALRQIDLQIHQGETVGIIGSNGAGKSTLLKILSRITDPTEGHVHVNGQIASLLEVGTGFHPELTGRENIYLNGAILGMRKADIDSKFDEIVSFAGIDRFLDTPVKRYSSGMYVRLAFSIAANLDPDILIVDEVLAVGDVAFQKKCLGRMSDACNRAKTVLFVSHNLAALESLCTRGIVLEKGRLVFDGTSKEAVQFYLNRTSEGLSDSDAHDIDLSRFPRSAHARPLLKRIQFFDGAGEPLSAGLPIGAPLRMLIHFELEEPSTGFDVAVAFFSMGGQRVCTAHSAYEPRRKHREYTGGQIFSCEIESLPLVPGDYLVQVSLDICGQEVDLVEDVRRISIINSDFYGTGVVPTKGIMLVQNRWQLASS